MLALQIENSEIESIFADKFKSNKKDLIDFIAKSFKQLKKTDDIFSFNTFDPKLNSYTISSDDDKDLIKTNPYKDIADTLSFANSLRKNSYR